MKKSMVVPLIVISFLAGMLAAVALFVYAAFYLEEKKEGRVLAYEEYEVPLGEYLVEMEEILYTHKFVMVLTLTQNDEGELDNSASNMLYRFRLVPPQELERHESSSKRYFNKQDLPDLDELSGKKM